MFDDVDYKKARANLILISLAVIVFILGEGKFKGTSFLGGSFTFDKPIVLSIAAATMFYFISWRFLLSTGNALKEFRWDIWTFTYSHKTYKDICDKWVDDINRVRDVDASEDDIKISDQAKRNFTRKSIFCPENPALKNGYYPPIICGGLLPKGFAFKVHDPVPMYYASSEDGKNDFPFKCDEDMIKIDIATADQYKLLYLEVVSIIKAIFLRCAFSDVIFPFLIGYSACLLLTHHLANKYTESIINWLLF